ncbi:hypothetical protein BKA62DRAFT_220806 [Auriculariales sp. MPI-PUGE-AT-0066]|nr:hypothetical protein BKA62DRAFT_220806 [Auriculariales sp. MPI-PUGE-AT-0066]
MYRAPLATNVMQASGPMSPSLSSPSTLYTPQGEVLTVAPLRAEPIRSSHPLQLTRPEQAIRSPFVPIPGKTLLEDSTLSSPVEPAAVARPQFHLPFRASTATTPLSSPELPLPPNPHSRPVTGSSIVSYASDLISPSSLSHSSSFDSMVQTPPDSPVGRQPPVIEEDSRTAGSSTPTLRAPMRPHPIQPSVVSSSMEPSPRSAGSASDKEPTSPNSKPGGGKTKKKFVLTTKAKSPKGTHAKETSLVSTSLFASIRG